MTTTRKPPVPYDPSVERIEADERDTTREIDETMGKIREKTFADSGHAMRSVHAKSHGIVVGELTVASGLPPELAQGLFAAPGRYPVVMRFSTTPGDVMDDKVSTPRGLALKVIGVDGEQVDGSTSRTQDFVLANGPTFNAPTPKQFLASLKPLAVTTDRAEGAKKVLSATLQAAERLVEAFGGKSVKLVSMGGHPETHVLGETFFTQVPIRYGAYIAKVMVAPVSPSLTALTDAPVDLKDKPDGLRAAVIDYFAANAGEWEVRVQLCTDLEAMPIEDASVEWSQEQSPYLTVARITTTAQSAWTDARLLAVNEKMSFSPWHALAAHRPLGAVMRARKLVYEQSAKFRAERNGRPVEEPTDVDALH